MEQSIGHLGETQSIQLVIEDNNKKMKMIREREARIVAFESDIINQIEVLIKNAISKVQNEKLGVEMVPAQK